MTQAQVFVTLSPFALLLTITCAIFAVVNKQKGRFNSLVLFLGETACIILFTALELSADTEAMVILFSRLTYSCIVLIPVSWLHFCIEYTFGGKKLGWLVPVSLIPVATLCIVWIPELQPLLWKKHAVVAIKTGLINRIYAYGPWFWVHAGYCYLLYFAGIAVVFRDFVLLDRAKRHQSLFNIVGVSIPVACNLLYLFRLMPGLERDFSALVFSLSGLAFLVSITKYRLLDPGIIEYKQIVNALPKAVIIIDLECIVQGINGQAERILDGASTLREGDRMPIAPEFLMMQTKNGNTIVTELQIGEKTLKAEITPIILNKAGFPGYSVQLYDTDEIQLHQMSRRELDVYELLSQGCSTKEIAARLCISENTAKTHIKHIYEKTNVNSRKALLTKEPTI
jgi:DNA-binding CsgD family transcriptional regulator